MSNPHEGQSLKGVRVHVASAFAKKSREAQEAAQGTAETENEQAQRMNISFSFSNDLAEGEDVKTAPMLMYDSYQKDGETKKRYSVEYSASQYEKILEMANNEGDKSVVIADLFPAKNGKGLVVNTKTLRTPEEPFNQAAHETNTQAAREAKAQARAQAAAAKAEAQAESESIQA